MRLHHLMGLSLVDDDLLRYTREWGDIADPRSRLPNKSIILSTGMSTLEQVESAAKLASSFKPMTKDEMKYWNDRLAPNATPLTLDYLREGYVDDGGWRAHLA